MAGGASCAHRIRSIASFSLALLFLVAPWAGAQTRPTSLEQDAAALRALRPGESGVSPLHSGKNAFVARMELAKRAQRSLDVQSYIWRPDNTGQALLERLLGAADRGVPVRLLLDDIHVDVDDPLLRSLDAHALIEVRIFNPVIKRRWRWLDAVFEWPRINRRMHNKAMIADGEAAIIGGRNIGDEYYDVGSDFDFFDFDVLTVGPVTEEITASFQQFWDHELAVPITKVAAGERPVPALEETREALRAHLRSFGATRYAQGLREARIFSPDNEWYWGPAHVYYDLPHKADPKSDDGVRRVAEPLNDAFERATREITIISPYVVPKRAGVKRFKRLRERDVEIALVTNSLSSTDVILTHVGYAKHRKEMLRAGMRLFEMKPQIQRGTRKSGAGMGSSSRASLHTKIFIIDGRHIHLGSANLDPRSFRLNTELMLFIDSPAFGEALRRWIDRVVETSTYRVELVNVEDAGGGHIVWTAAGGGQAVRYTADPESSWWRRAAVWLLSFFPIENQL